MAVTIYYDPDGGNDANDGSSHAQRVATINRARNLVNGEASSKILGLCGTSNTSETFTTNWAGTSGNHAVFGSYYMDGPTETQGVSGAKHELNRGDNAYYGFWQSGGTPQVGDKITPTRNGRGYVYDVTAVSGALGTNENRPWTITVGATFTNGGVTIRCLGTIPSQVNYNGIFNKKNGNSYFTLENIKLSNYWGRGVNIDDTSSSSNINITNVDVHTIGYAAATNVRTLNTVVYDGCDFYRCGLSAPAAGYSPANGGTTGWMNTGLSGGGAGISTQYITLRNSTVRDCARELVLAQHDHTINDNIFYNVYIGPYFTNGQDSTAYNNIIIGGTDNNFHWLNNSGKPGSALLFSTESQDGKDNTGHKAYNNLICSFHIGINTGAYTSGTAPRYNFQNCTVVHNTVVDCNYSLSHWSAGQTQTYTGSVLKNNLFARYTAGTMLFNYSRTIATTDYNLWPSTPPANLSGANDVVTASPGLAKTSGWEQQASHTSVDETDFALTETSPAVGAGDYLSAYENDYNGNSRSSRTDIGAINFTSSADTTDPVLASPDNLDGTAQSQTEILWTWDDATDNVAVTAYDLQTSDNGSDWTNLTTISQSSKTANGGYSQTGLAANTTYYFRYRARDAAGNTSGYSSSANETTNPPSDTTAPTFGGLVSGYWDQITGEIILQWIQATDDISQQSKIKYNVYHSTTEDGFDYNSPEPVVPLIGVSYASLPNYSDGDHYFVVRAEDEAGNEDTNTVKIRVKFPQDYSNSKLRVMRTIPRTYH